MANLNDLDKDGTIDQDDLYVPGGVDLIKLVINKPEAAAANAAHNGFWFDEWKDKNGYPQDGWTVWEAMDEYAAFGDDATKTLDCRGGRELGLKFLYILGWAATDTGRFAAYPSRDEGGGSQWYKSDSSDWETKPDMPHQGMHMRYRLLPVPPPEHEEEAGWSE